MLRSLRSSRTARDVGQLATGTAIAQALPLLATPVLSRLYTPAQFGEFGVFAALLMGLSLVVSGRYEIAVPMPSSDTEAFHLFALSMLVTFVSGLVLLVLAIMLVGIVGDLGELYEGASNHAALMLPLGIAAASTMQACSYWLTRTGRFRIISIARAFQGALVAGLGIVLGVAATSPSGLILSVVAGYAVAAAMLLWAVARGNGTRFRHIEPRLLRSVAAGYREFPLLNSSHAMIDVARDSGTLILFAALFGPTYTGYLTQTLRILRAPMSLLGQAVAQVFYPRASTLLAEGKSITSATARTIRGVLAFSIPFYAIMALAGPWLFAVVLGEQWRESGVYARVLSPWLAVVLVLSALSLLPVLRRRQPEALGLNVADTLLRLAGIIVGAALAGPIGALVGLSIAGLAVGLFQLTWYVRLSREPAPSSPTVADRPSP